MNNNEETHTKERESNRFIRRIDRFGVPVASFFNADEREQKHRTLPGGLLSLLFYICILFYAVYKAAHLLGQNRDVERIQEVQTDLTRYLRVNGEAVSVNELNTKIFMRIRGYRPGKVDPAAALEILDLENKEVKKYLTLVGGRKCRPVDLIQDLDSRDFYICSDISFRPGKLTWKKRQQHDVQIHLCKDTDSKVKTCERDANKIKDFLRYLVVETFVQYPDISEQDKKGVLTKQVATSVLHQVIPGQPTGQLRSLSPQIDLTLTPVATTEEIKLFQLSDKVVQYQDQTENNLLWPSSSVQSKNFHKLFGVSIKLSETSISITPVPYTFLDSFILDIGAFIFVLNGLFQLMLYPIQKQSLLLKLMKMLYTVRTYDSESVRLLVNTEKDKI